MYTAFLSVAMACGTPGLMAALALGALACLYPVPPVLFWESCWFDLVSALPAAFCFSCALWRIAPANITSARQPAIPSACRPAVQRDGLPDHLRHRLCPAVLWHRLRAAGQVVPGNEMARGIMEIIRHELLALVSQPSGTKFCCCRNEALMTAS